MVMNKILNILFLIGLLLFLFVAFNSFGGSSGIFIIFDPYQGHRIEVPYYDFITIAIALICMFILLVVLIGKFKVLPDLRYRNPSYNLQIDDKNLKEFDFMVNHLYRGDINLGP